MTSEPVRDSVGDHLLTPSNSVLVVIDYQPSQLQAMSSMDRDLLVDNVVSVARLARTFNLPVVLSTVNVASGQGPTLPELKAALPDAVEIDRTTMNAWEDVEFRQAVASVANTVFSEHGRGAADLDDPRRSATGDRLQAEIRKLAPEDDVQRTLQAHALELSNEVAKMRLLTITQAQGSIPGGFLIVLLLWLSIMFAGFGLVTARNPTVVVTLFLCALSLAGAIFMIEELNRPLEGFLKISGAPIQYALSHIGQ